MKHLSATDLDVIRRLDKRAAEIRAELEAVEGEMAAFLKVDAGGLEREHVAYWARGDLRLEGLLDFLGIRAETKPQTGTVT